MTTPMTWEAPAPCCGNVVEWTVDGPHDPCPMCHDTRGDQ